MRGSSAAVGQRRRGRARPGGWWRLDPLLDRERRKGGGGPAVSVPPRRRAAAAPCALSLSRSRSERKRDKENFNLAPTYGNIAIFIFSLAHQRQRWWCHCRPCSMWHNHVHCLLWGRSDARLQVRLPHPLFTMCSVHLAGSKLVNVDFCSCTTHHRN
ncbi:hypothetical protein VPH35_061478 [Triticum aestivum]